MTEIISIIQSLGFPVFVSVYLLIFMQKTLEQNRDALNELKNISLILRMEISEIKEIIKKCQK